MSDTFSTINDRPIFWTEAGTTHRCEGADVHPGIRLLWTKCERDVPANTAFLPGDGDRVDCPKCLAEMAARNPHSLVNAIERPEGVHELLAKAFADDGATPGAA